MLFRKSNIHVIAVCILLMFSKLSVAQMLQDTSVLSLIKKEMSLIYDMQFEEARAVHSEISATYPGHPVNLLLKGIMIYWEDFPLLHTTSQGAAFEETMTRCIELSDRTRNSRYEAECLLTDLSSRGMLLLYYAGNNLSMKVFPLTVNTYQGILRSFDLAPECVDLYYFTGIYNYYREAYPRIYPVYKPLAMLFHKGDMKTGLNDLEKAASGSVVMKAESSFILSWIYLNFENNYAKSLYFCRTLHEQYPHNRLYLSEYLKILLLMKKYDEADKLISSAKDDKANKYYDGQLFVLKGILTEKKYHDPELARQFYNSGIINLTSYGDYGNEYAAYAYFGLSRIAESEGQKNLGRKYRNEAVKLAYFKKIDFDQ